MDAGRRALYDRSQPMAPAPRITLLARFALLGSLLASGPGCSGGDAPGIALEPPHALRHEAGFIEIEPISYAIVGDAGRAEMTSSAARLWYAFQPADSDPTKKPLAILFNGGPGASTGILFAFNTARQSFDPVWNGGAEVGPGPASFTAFANLLYVDARATGFSYGLAKDADDTAVREAEFTVKNFNPFLDAADFARVLLRFLDHRPELRDNPVIVVGESYGGIRASILLDMLLRPDTYAAGSAGYEDPALASEIEAHTKGVAARGAGIGPDDAAARQFGRQVLIQPRISSDHQDIAASALLDADDSPLHGVASETGVPFVPCTAKPPPCNAYQNALKYLGAAGRDIYDARRPDGYTFARFADVAPRFSTLAPLSAALGFDPTSIDELFAESRVDAYRTITAEPIDEPLREAFGQLKPWDRYYLLEAYDLVLDAFSGSEAEALNIHRRSPRWGALFLQNLLSVRTFITNATNDIVIYTPALPSALAAYTDLVEASSVDASGRLLVRYVGGAERAARFPSYEASGHVVTLDQPVELADDIRSWLDEE